jgi:hypothetical protein
MANLIRLKQIESGSALQTSAQIGTDISGSVIGIVSSSLSGALAIIATDVEVAAISASIAASIGIVATGVGLVTTSSFHAYTASLGDTFATDLEVYQTASAIIDQGEF